MGKIAEWEPYWQATLPENFAPDASAVAKFWTGCAGPPEFSAPVRASDEGDGVCSTASDFLRDRRCGPKKRSNVTFIRTAGGKFFVGAGFLKNKL